MSFLSSSDIQSLNKQASGSHKVSDNDEEEKNDERFQKLSFIVKNELHRNFDIQYPANPLLPKTFMKMEDSPKFGGLTKFIKLMKFKGQDDGKSQQG